MKRINWKTWTGTATFWKTLSKRSLIVFLAGVFCLFGSLGFILDSSNPQATTAGELAMNILVRACFAVGWAFFGTHRMFKSMISLAGVQVSVIWLLHHAYSNAPKLASNSAALGDKLALDSAGAMALVIGGYVLFLLFFQWEGKRFLAAHTEIALATEIHRSLVPELSFQTSAFQFFGASFPSGAVGGDLVDVAVRNDTWLGYVAAVCGHGVPAGVLMSMVKSAVRMRLACGGHQSELLDDLNGVLKPLLAQNMVPLATFVVPAAPFGHRAIPRYLLSAALELAPGEPSTASSPTVVSPATESPATAVAHESVPGKEVRLPVTSSLAAATAPVAEPQYLNNFYAVDAGGRLIELERTTVTFHAKTMMLPGYASMKMTTEFKPGHSSVRLLPNAEFVVRGRSMIDPLRRFELRALKRSRDHRGFVMTTAHGTILGGSAKSTLDDGGIPVRFEEYGVSSYRITADQPLPPGEYALTAGGIVSSCSALE